MFLIIPPARRESWLAEKLCERILNTFTSLSADGCMESDCAIDLADVASLDIAWDTPIVACTTTMFNSMLIVLTEDVHESSWLNDLTAFMNLADMPLAAMACAAERTKDGTRRPFANAPNACDSAFCSVAARVMNWSAASPCAIALESEASLPAADAGESAWLMDLSKTVAERPMPDSDSDCAIARNAYDARCANAVNWFVCAAVLSPPSTFSALPVSDSDCTSALAAAAILPAPLVTDSTTLESRLYALARAARLAVGNDCAISLSMPASLDNAELYVAVCVSVLIAAAALPASALTVSACDSDLPIQAMRCDNGLAIRFCTSALILSAMLNAALPAAKFCTSDLKAAGTRPATPLAEKSCVNPLKSACILPAESEPVSVCGSVLNPVCIRLYTLVSENDCDMDLTAVCNGLIRDAAAVNGSLFTLSWSDVLGTSEYMATDCVTFDIMLCGTYTTVM
jgi:hypothetical protein